MPGAHQSLLLKHRVRRERRSLILFWEMVGVMLQAGYDLAYAWPSALSALTDGLSPAFRKRLDPGETRFSEHLQQLAQRYPDPRHRLWFGALADLYGSGCPLAPTLAAMTEALRAEQEREWQAHLRSLPLKTSLILALFFVLPALALIFLTVLSEMSETFG